MKILILGASGLVGSTLTPFLRSKGHEVFRGVRNKKDQAPDAIYWDFMQGEFNLDAFIGIDAVVNLAGENIASHRWTEEKKKRIYNSRVQGTQILSECLSRLENPPKVLVNASAVGYYGDRGDEVLTEKSTPGSGFLSDLCTAWEAATSAAKEKGIRVVTPRLGLVLSNEGGALAKMLPVFRMGLGGVLGNGEQYMSFVAIDDLIKMILFVLEHDEIFGPVNFTTPFPVKNREFTKTLGGVLHRPTVLPLPAFAAKILFGAEMANELLLSSTKVKPTVLEESGYTFQYPKIQEALSYLLD